MDALKLQIGSDAFSAQYQQSPVPPGGAMVKRHWIKRYSELPPDSERLVDTAKLGHGQQGRPDNDWSVCTTWIVTRKKQWYLIDVWRQRVDYPALKANVQTLAKQWNARRVLVEDTGAGTSLVQELRGQVSGIIAVKPEGDKASRMAVASAKFEAGQVLLPERAPWLPDLEAELFAFPGSRHDDQCDSISQALLDKNNSLMDVAFTRETGTCILARQHWRTPAQGTGHKKLNSPATAVTDRARSNAAVIATPGCFEADRPPFPALALRHHRACMDGSPNHRGASPCPCRAPPRGGSGRTC